MKRSKKYQKALEKLDKQKEYTLSEALQLISEISTASFDASVELHVNLQLNDKQKKSGIKGSITLPYQSKSQNKRILVLTTPQYEKQAEKADYVGGEDYIKKIKNGWNEFDVVLATPDIMPKIAVLGKTLGPKGLMPNPKNSTVTTELKEVIQQYQKGKIDFKADEQGSIHQNIGKISMKKVELEDNVLTFLKAVIASTKKVQAIPFKSIFLCPTMGPSIRLNTSSIEKELTK